jgi:hypothetical protein
MYEPIDVVYTWVNGSDPRWLMKMKHWKETLRSSSSVQSNETELNATNSESDAHSANRYRDSNELMYSMRSLEMYAPWIRQIFLVTDNQVPKWLDISHPRIKMISHTDIFKNRSALPVFSSPAIEAHLHLIPGLSKKFVYFNDDVFLGKPVFPEDFTSPSGVQKFVFAWDVPKCAPGCNDNWIGDGYCDKACNVSSCNFDYPDCVNATGYGQTTSRGGKNDANAKYAAMCSPGCPETWMADKTCDIKCKNEECGWDMGDCGLEAMSQVPHAVVTPLNSRLVVFENETDGSSLTDRNESSVSLPVVMTALSGVPSLFFNVSFLACQVAPVGAPDCKANFSYTKATYSGGDDLVHVAVIVSKHDMLGVTLYHAQEGAPPYSASPVDVDFTVSGRNSVTGKTVQSSFRLRVVPPGSSEIRNSLEGVPEGMQLVSGHSAFCAEQENESDESSHATTDSVVAVGLVPQPFRLPEAHERHKDKNGLAAYLDSRESPSAAGVAVYVTLNPAAMNRMPRAGGSAESLKFGDEKLSDIVVRQRVSTVGRKTVQSLVPLCAVLSSVHDLDHSRGGRALGSGSSDRMHAMFSPACESSGECLPLAACRNLTLRQYLTSAENERSVRALSGSVRFPRVIADGLIQRAALVSSEDISSTMVLLAVLPSQAVAIPPVVVSNATGNSSEPLISYSSKRWFQVRIELFHDTSPTESREYYASRPVGSDAYIPLSNRVACLVTNVKWSYALLNNSNSSDHSDASATYSPSANSHRRLLDLRSSSRISAIRVVPADDDNEDPSVSAAHRAAVEEETPMRSFLRALVATSDDHAAISRVVSHSYYSGALSAEAQKARPKEQSSLRPSPLLKSALAKLLRVDFSLVGQNGHRRLTGDTYGQSLIHVNRLYHKAFGSDNRKVPAHVPHMIDRDVMNEMQQKWAAEWAVTAANRFRSPADMQYSFSYYYYVINRNKAQPPSISRYVEEEIDTNRDGVLDPNEFLTLASIVHGRSPRADEISDLYDCVFGRGNYTNRSSVPSPSAVDSSSEAIKGDAERLRRKISRRTHNKIAKILKSREAAEGSLDTNGQSDESGRQSQESDAQYPKGTLHRSIVVEPFPSIEVNDDIFGHLWIFLCSNLFLLANS